MDICPPDSHKELQFVEQRYASLVCLRNKLAAAVTTRHNQTSSLNHSENSSSNEDLFLADLTNLKEILIRNGYPEHLIDQKFFDFLCDPEKPPKPEISYTLSLNYTSSQVEYYAKELVHRMKSFIRYKLYLISMCVTLSKVSKLQPFS